MAQPETETSRRGFLLAAGAGIVAAAATRAAAIDLAPPDRQPPNLDVPKPMPRKTGWAIVGLGELALGRIMPAFSVTEYCRPVALVSGHPEKARQVAEHYGIDTKSIYNYDNFDSIRDNPAIDVVYIVLPNSMHAEYTIRAFGAGKHVLCEKPMALNAEEARRMIDAGKKAGRKLMIGYRLHYEPYNKKMIEMSRKKEFGPLRVFEADNVQQVQAPNIRLSKKLGGGPLLDLGVYCVNAARYISGEEPASVMAMQFRPSDDPRFAEVPDRVTFQLRFPSGALATSTCGFSALVSRRYRAFCDKGWMELDPAFDYEGLRLRTGKTEGAEFIRLNSELVLPAGNQFADEMDHFGQCVQDNKVPLTPGEEGLADLRVTDAIQKAADTGTLVQIS
jgi:predicted dehydrogenase